MRVSSLTLMLAALCTMPLAALGQAAPAVAPPVVATAPVAAGTSSDQASDLDTVICKKYPPPTGSHLGAKTVCDTKRHWQASQATSQEDLSKLQKSASPGSGN